MKKSKLDNSASHTRFGLVQFLLALLLFYFLCMSFEIPFIFRTGSGSDDGLPRHMVVVGREANRAIVGEEEDPHRPFEDPGRVNRAGHIHREFKTVSEIFTNESFFDAGGFSDELSTFHETVKHAISTGRKMWGNLGSGLITKPNPVKNRTEKCPDTVSVTGSEFLNRSRILVLPCGLTLGSHVTVVATPHWAHAEKGDDGKTTMVTQFMMELQGLKAVEGEDPPRILHFNPRVRGDWSGRPVIEQNTCYRMQWGSALRCDGHESSDDEELGYHISVDGRHITSFPYRTGFVLEDATGLAVKGNIDVHSIYASSLPSTNPSFAPQKHLEMQSMWKAPALPEKPVELFIGILSAGNHFAERMAVRKSWMQQKLVRSSKVVARFFVALHARKEVNVDLKKEAEYFGDIVIVPYMDHYDLVVLKTVAICEYGEWPEEYYPPYANGPGYILSYDIAKFIVDDFEHRRLRLFKMEDVSMGMWVEKFNETRPVEVVHSLRFCQFGCIEDYFTAHYQSPRQMICMWDKLQRLGKPHCCNMR
ncbi:hypothetical protein IGI04_026815 [Brassica rapa subsp. trilocularis]|uniref:Galectin domain-containing protein n=1 Tax=Brassica rapa subsp. trilocularis TaxID=1813537 RepID=A0ABQ7L0X3_BRACM|nr:hypothetical protein IGI04_026815 [Brassica rapa subsp. trilocularis]